MKRAVVTGATGMIAASLIEECVKNGTEVTAVARPGTARLRNIPVSPLVTVLEIELKDLPRSVGSGYDVFYHFAWGHTDKGGRDDIAAQYENIGLTLEAAAAAKAMGCGKFIFAGSQAEYGAAEGVITSETPVNPMTAYGTAKYAAGKLAELYCRQNGMDFVRVRVFSVYGKLDGADTMVMTAIRKMLRGEKCLFTPAEHMWDYLYSADAGRAFYLIGAKSTGIRVYCLGSGVSRPLKDFIYIIRDTINPSLPLGIGSLPYNGTPVNLIADISALTADTGFKPEVSFEEGIKRVTAYLKETYKA